MSNDLKVIFGLLLAGVVMIFVFNPPCNTSDWAAWVQAIGSIAAIIGSFYLVNHQHKLVLQHEEKAKAIHDEKTQRNLITAIQAEIAQHYGRLKGIADNYARVTNEEFKRQVYPHAQFSHPVYTACAAQVGGIENEFLRTRIIYIYTTLGPFYEILNRTSELLRDFENLTKIELQELKAWESQIENEAIDLPGKIKEIFDLTGAKIPE
jgi:hypothetical protein